MHDGNERVRKSPFPGMSENENRGDQSEAGTPTQPVFVLPTGERADSPAIQRCQTSDHALRPRRPSISNKELSRGLGRSALIGNKRAASLERGISRGRGERRNCGGHLSPPLGPTSDRGGASPRPFFLPRNNSGREFVRACPCRALPRSVSRAT